jgi:acetolactate synthase-1/2/3 large subunit
MPVAQKTREIPKVENGAEAFLEMLNANEVKYVFNNSRSDHPPLLEALAKFQKNGRLAPKVILCLYENMAMSAAHGYAMATGKPQAVLVHVGDGTANVGGNLTNAFRGRVPVLLCAGASPRSEMRFLYINWVQDEFDQAGQLRDRVKWDYFLKTSKNIDLVVQRALQVANEEPPGPVYLVLPPDVLVEPLEDFNPIRPELHQTSGGLRGDPERMPALARMLMDAEFPLAVGTYVGRHVEAVKSLVALSETLGIGYTDVWPAQYANFPTDHPHYLSAPVGQLLPQVDTLFVIDCDVPWTPKWYRPREGARIAQLDIDPVKLDMPLWDFPIDLSVRASSRLALPELAEIVSETATEADRKRIEGRKERLARLHKELKDSVRARVSSLSGKSPIEPDWLHETVNRIKTDDTIVVNETVTTGKGELLLERKKPGTFFGNGGAALGFSLGGALGIKLANPDREVFCLVADGSYIFGSPIAVHWAQRQYKVPFLTVVYNNCSYQAVRLSTQAFFPKGVSVDTDNFVSAPIDPPPDFELVAKSCGLYAETVREPDDLEPALTRARDRVRSGQPALVNVYVNKG